MLGVPDLIVQISVGQLLRLDLEVDAVRARRARGGELETFQDVEHLQGCDALAGRWDLIDPNTPVVGRDRLDERRLVCREVFFGEVPAGLLNGARDSLCYLAPVEGVRPIFGNGRERGRKVHLGEDLPRNRGPTCWQECPRCGVVFAEHIFVLSPVAGYDLGNGMAVLGQLPGWLE